MNKRPSRGVTGYIILITTLLLIAILLNGGLNKTENRRIEYPTLLEQRRTRRDPEQFPGGRVQDHDREGRGFPGPLL